MLRNAVCPFTSPGQPAIIVLTMLIAPALHLVSSGIPEAVSGQAAR